MESEGILRISFFVAIFAAVAAWEIFRPKRLNNPMRRSRWTKNLGLMLLNTLTIRLLFPTAAVGVAIYAQDQQLGLLNQLDIPLSLAILIGIIALDLFIYFQHVLFHAIPTLWRLHMVHHTDLEYDLTTGVRFHPIEIVLSMLIKFMVILALGPAPVAVLIFEILLSSCAMFNHGNINLPSWLDKLLRKIVVTPDMHRVHHSTTKQETNSNYGFCLSWWDKIFGTYKTETLQNQQTMDIGLENYRDANELSYSNLLKLPFKGKGGSYPINK